MKKIYLILCILLLSFTTQALNSDNIDLKTVFTHNYYNEYTPRQCGSNIKKFTEKLHSLAFNLDQAHILIITNEGSSVFGMVNALQARYGGGLDKQTGLYKAGEQNWYHHVVLDYNGFIYDFDFTNEPNIQLKHKYFNQMYFDNYQSSYFKIPSDKKRADYLIELISAKDYIQKIEAKQPLPSGIKLRLENYLNL